MVYKTFLNLLWIFKLKKKKLIPDIESTVWPNKKHHIDDMLFTVPCALQTHLTLTT